MEGLEVFGKASPRSLPFSGTVCEGSPPEELRRRLVRVDRRVDQTGQPLTDRLSHRHGGEHVDDVALGRQGRHADVVGGRVRRLVAQRSTLLGDGGCHLHQALHRLVGDGAAGDGQLHLWEGRAHHLGGGGLGHPVVAGEELRDREVLGVAQRRHDEVRRVKLGVPHLLGDFHALGEEGRPRGAADPLEHHEQLEGGLLGVGVVLLGGRLVGHSDTFRVSVLFRSSFRNVT